MVVPAPCEEEAPSVLGAATTFHAPDGIGGGDGGGFALINHSPPDLTAVRAEISCVRPEPRGVFPSWISLAWFEHLASSDKGTGVEVIGERGGHG